MAPKVVIRSSKKPPVHPYGKVESIARFVLDGSGACETTTVVQVWREETDMEPCHLSNMDLKEAVEGKVDHADCRAIARILIEMPRVTSVEAVDYFSGQGVRITRD